MLSEEQRNAIVLAAKLCEAKGSKAEFSSESYLLSRAARELRSLLTQPEPLVWAVSPIQLAGAIVHVANDIPSTFDLLEYRDRVACRIRTKRDGSFSLKVEFKSLESAKAACELLRPFLAAIGGGE